MRYLWLIAIVLLLGGCQAPDDRLLDPREAMDMIQRHRDDADFLLIDARTPEEFRLGHIAGARLINYYDPDFSDQLDSLDRNALILFYCRSGNRTSHVLKMAHRRGFARVYDLRGGILAWQQAGFSLVRP
jgi:rhodanese-related sulfurtransferase